MNKKYSYWINSGQYSMLQKVLILLFGVISFMILARSLSKHDLGVWGLFLIISSIVETLRNALIRNGYVLFINSKKEELHAGIEYAAIFINIVFSILLIASILPFSPAIESLFNAPGLSILLYYFCITLVVLIPFSYLEIFSVSRLDFKAVFWMYFVRNGLMLSIVAFYFFSAITMTLSHLAIIYLISTVAGGMTGFLASRKYQKPLIKRDKNLLKQFISFSKYVFSNNLFSLVFRSTDSFMTASLISAGASAFYSTCTRITNLVDMPSQVFADIMFPKAAQIMKTNDLESIKRIYEKTVAATLTFTIPAILVILIFPRQLLLIVAGKEYIEAAPILQTIIFYGFFLPFIKQFGNVTDVMGKPHINSTLMTVFAAFNVGLNILAIRRFGLFGSAYATLSSYFLLFITTQIILKRLLKTSPINIFRNIFQFYSEYIKMLRNFLGKYADAR
jgi:O-antigen/teichoic acid export membrane protein